MSTTPNPESRSHNLPANRNLQLACCLLIICCLSFALRLYLLDAQSIWWDEAISLHLATSTVTDLLADRAAHVHPPLYFLLLKGWVALAGTSAYSARFFSAWFNTLLVPAVYTFGRRYLNRATGLIAASLTAISPLYVIYSQEARVYALLPLVFLALLALAHRLADFTPQEGTEKHSTWLHWGLFAGVEIVGLYMHYVVVLAVAYANLLLLGHLWRQRRELTRWLASTALVALVCMPWAVTVLLNRAAVLADVGAGDPFTEPLPWGFFVRLLWTFQWSGLTAAPGYAPLYVATLALAGLFLIALAFLWASTRTRATTSRLLAHWLAPLVPTLLVWQAKPLSHPRYIALFAIALLLLAGYTIAQLGRQRFAGRALAVLLGLALLVPSSIALQAWYFDPRFAKDDVRGLAAWLEAETTAGDLIVAPWQDWSLDYAYHGPAPIVRPNPANEAATWHTLESQTAPSGQVFLVSYPRANQDRRNLIPYALESAGSLVERHSFKGLVVHVYTLSRPVEPPPVGAPADADLGPLHLTAAWVEPNPAAGAALTLALTWRKQEAAGERYRVSLRLRDLDGWELAANDDWLLDLRTLPTDRWNAGEEATTYHVLPLVPGTPPLTYTVSIGVYATDSHGTLHRLDLLDAAGNPQGQSYEVGVVALAPARGLSADPYGVALDLPPLPEPTLLADGLLLEAAALDRAALAPGQSVFVTLRWRALAAPLPDLRPVLALSQAGSTLATVASAPAGGRYPTGRWQAGEAVLEHRRLTVPPTAADGPATVTIQLGDRQAVLGQVTIAAGEHTFAPPPMAHEIHVRFGDVAELLGYDLATGPYTADQTVPITLYWQALEGAASADRTVFTHLLAADGHLVGQHDGPPVAGTQPTTGWLAGEIVADRHEMAFREPYAGPVHVEVGWYDPTTLERVPTENGASFILLPTPLTIQTP